MVFGEVFGARWRWHDALSLRPGLVGHPAFAALLEARLAGRDALAKLVDAALRANLLNAPT